jgi:predicted SprT family Zn-dependent metalloprotease
MYKDLEEILKENIEKLEKRGFFIRYDFDSNLYTVASYLPSEHKIVLNPYKIKSTLENNPLENNPLHEFYTLHLIDRILSHEIIHYLQTEIAKRLNENGQDNLVTNLFDVNKASKLYREATEDVNRGSYIITEENTFYAKTTKLKALEHFFREFEAYSFNFSYKKDREIFRKKNNLEYYMEKIDFNKLFSDKLNYKAEESYKLYSRVSYILARELAREIGEKLNIKLDGFCSSYSLYIYFKDYRKIFIEEAHKWLNELLRDGIKRKEFFDKNILKLEEYKKDPKIFNTLYETYKRILNDVYFSFKEYKDYIKKSNPLFQEVFKFH